MNFINDGKLADMQDSLFSRYLKGDRIPEEEIMCLEDNAWVSLADFLAPCNLVIRHLCLIDLLRKHPLRTLNITCQLKILAPKDLYLEGYSYWLYTKPFIVEHLKKFSDDTLKAMVRSIDENFVKTCYTVEGIRYPAPFGDLRYGPLEEDLQFSKITVPETISIFPVSKSKNKFNIKPAPIGFNLHVPINEKVYSIIDGKVIDTEAKEEFKWYTGYKDKYPTKWSELRDMCRIKRILSLFRI